jgi:hypothetical protein
MRLAESCFVALCTDSDEQASFAAHGTAHPAAYHEAEAAHHFLLEEVAPAGEHLAHSFRGSFIVGHASWDKRSNTEHFEEPT